MNDDKFNKEIKKLKKIYPDKSLDDIAFMVKIIDRGCPNCDGKIEFIEMIETSVRKFNRYKCKKCDTYIYPLIID